MAGGKVVPTDDGFAVSKQAINEIAADESGSAGDEDFFHDRTRSLRWSRKFFQNFYHWRAIARRGDISRKWRIA
jgi:hypothetical protein